MRMTRLGRLATLIAAACLTWSTTAAAGPSTPQLEVEGKGVISAVAGTCPDARMLTILGIPVTVNSSTVLPAGQTCADLVVGQHVDVRGMLTVSGGALSVVATTIEIEDESSEVEGEGRVTALTGACPDVTLTVDGITVTADALTKYVPGGLGASCAAIKVGTKIKVKAVPAVAPATGFRARLIQIRGHRNFMEGESRITSVEGTCPNKTLFFGTLEVHVNGATLYRGGTCDSLEPGVRAFAKAFQDDGTGPITATVMYVKARHVEGRSTVSSVTGTCPNLTIVVGGHTVVTNASTVFEDGTCSSITVGTKLHVKGDMLTDDGSVIAEGIDIEGGGRSGPHRGEGIAAGVTGTCPAKSFTINGILVKTDASTTFEHGTCADLENGRRVEVEAYVDATRVTASRIELK